MRLGLLMIGSIRTRALTGTMAMPRSAALLGEGGDALDGDREGGAGADGEAALAGDRGELVEPRVDRGRAQRRRRARGRRGGTGTLPCAASPARLRADEPSSR